MIRNFVPALLIATSLLCAQASNAAPARKPAAFPEAQSAAADSKKMAEVRALVDRQVLAWEKNDFEIAAGDWLPTGELISPGAHLAAKDLKAAMTDYFAHFSNAHVTVKNVFLSPDGNKVAIEWDWEVTRNRDGKRATTHDAIIVDLKGGKISSWREYFDLGNSVDAQP